MNRLIYFPKTNKQTHLIARHLNSIIAGQRYNITLVVQDKMATTKATLLLRENKQTLRWKSNPNLATASMLSVHTQTNDDQSIHSDNEITVHI